MLDCHAENGEYPPECAAELLDARLNRAPCDFTGLLIDTAGAAPGVLEALHAHGLNIPGDLSCIVIDNLTQLDRSNPPLTAVGVDQYAFGDRVADEFDAKVICLFGAEKLSVRGKTVDFDIAVLRTGRLDDPDGMDPLL